MSRRPCLAGVARRGRRRRPGRYRSAAALELRALLRGSEDGTIDGPAFVPRALRWLEQLLHHHPDPAEAAMPTRMPAVERRESTSRSAPPGPSA